MNKLTYFFLYTYFIKWVTGGAFSFWVTHPSQKKVTNEPNSIPEQRYFEIRQDFVGNLERYVNKTKKYPPVALTEAEMKLLSYAQNTKLIETKLKLNLARARYLNTKPFLFLLLSVIALIGAVNFGAGAEKTTNNTLKYICDCFQKIGGDNSFIIVRYLWVLSNILLESTRIYDFFFRFKFF